MSIAYAMLYVY